LRDAEAMKANERSYMMNLLRLLTSRQYAVGCGAGCVLGLFSNIAERKKPRTSLSCLLIYALASYNQLFSWRWAQ